MSTLKARDYGAFLECRRIYKTRFWALCSGVPSEVIDELQSTNHSQEERHLISVVGDPRSALSEYGDNLLHCAAMTGCAAAVHRCIDVYGMGVNDTNKRGETALFLAFRSGHKAVVDLLLNRGADPTIYNKYSENLMHWLGSFDDDSVIDDATKLVAGGLDLHQEAEKDESLMDSVAASYFHRTCPGTPLHRAVQLDNSFLVAVLLHLGADSGRVSHGGTPLCRAVMSHNLGILKLLLDFPLSRNINEAIWNVSRTASFTTLQKAIRDNHESERLFYTNDSYTPNCTKEILEILTRNGAGLLGGSQDTLFLALARRNYAATEFLLSSGSWDLESQLQLSGRRGEADHVAGTPLGLCVIARDGVLVDMLLRHGANPNGKIQRQWGTDPEAELSPLFICVTTGGGVAERIARALIKAGADMEAFSLKDPRETPLSRALSFGYFRLASLLVEHGARLDGSPVARWPNYTPLKLLFIYNILDQSMYRAYEFLISHPAAHIPFWAEVNLETVFHSLFNVAERRRRNIDPNNIRAIFNLLRRQFPQHDITTLCAPSGWKLIHLAVYHVNLVGVQLLLEVGCDPRERIEIDYAQCWTLAKSFPQASESDEKLQELYEEILEVMKKWRNIPEGTSAVDIARGDLFVEIPLFVRDNPDEYEEFQARRREIKRLLRLWDEI